MNYQDLISSRPELFSNESASLRVITDSNLIADWLEHKRALLAQANTPLEWANIGIVFEDSYFVMIRDLVEFPADDYGKAYLNGYLRLYARAYLEGGAAIVVILPEKNGQLLLIRHYRHATRMFHWEIPRGFGEPGVNSETQAINELREEIQGEVSSITNLGTMYHNTGLDGNPANLFLAHMISTGKLQIEEGIEDSKWFSVSEIEQMIADGEITDGFTIAAYTRAKLKGLI